MVISKFISQKVLQKLSQWTNVIPQSLYSKCKDGKINILIQIDTFAEYESEGTYLL